MHLRSCFAAVPFWIKVRGDSGPLEGRDELWRPAAQPRDPDFSLSSIRCRMRPLGAIV